MCHTPDIATASMQSPRATDLMALCTTMSISGESNCIVLYVGNWWQLDTDSVNSPGSYTWLIDEFGMIKETFLPNIVLVCTATVNVRYSVTFELVCENV